jgi:hypothetical protein
LDDLKNAWILEIESGTTRWYWLEKRLMEEAVDTP